MKLLLQPFKGDESDDAYHLVTLLEAMNGYKKKRIWAELACLDLEMVYLPAKCGAILFIPLSN